MNTVSQIALVTCVTCVAVSSAAVTTNADTYEYTQQGLVQKLDSLIVRYYQPRDLPTVQVDVVAVAKPKPRKVAVKEPSKQKEVAVVQQPCAAFIIQGPGPFHAVAQKENP